MDLIEIIKLILNRKFNIPIIIDELTKEVNRNYGLNTHTKRIVSYEEVLFNIKRESTIFKIEKNKVSLLNPNFSELQLLFFSFINDLSVSNNFNPEFARIFGIICLYEGYRKSHIYNLDLSIEKTNIRYENISDLNDEIISPFLGYKLNEKQINRAKDFIRKVAVLSEGDSNDFGYFFNEIINEYSNTDVGYSGSFSTPKLVTNFISQLYSYIDVSSIYDPFAGNSSLLVGVTKEIIKYNKNLVVEANDINSISAIVGAMNLSINNIIYNYKISDFAHNISDKLKYDYIVTSPPFAFRRNRIKDETEYLRLDIDGRELIFDKIGNDSQVEIILTIVSLLSMNGRAVVVVPNNLLFSIKNTYLWLREFLLAENFVSAVISLPNNTFKPYISISASILILEKQRKSNESIFFFDGSELSLETFDNLSSEIISAFHQKIQIERSVIIHRQNIDFLSVDLMPSKYLLQTQFDDTYKEILTIANLKKGVAISKNNLNSFYGIPYIQIKDLYDGDGLGELDISKVDTFVGEGQISKLEDNYIPANSILISTVGSKLKVSLYKSEMRAVCSRNIIVISPILNTILPEYLYTQLQSDYVQKQIKSIAQRLTIFKFPFDNFKQVKIKLIPISDQRDFVVSYFGKQLNTLIQMKNQEREDELYNMIASIKHELKQPISSMGMDIKSLTNFLQNKASSTDSLSLEEPVVELFEGQDLNENLNLVLSNVLSRMDSSIIAAQETLSKTEEILNVGVGAFSPEKIRIKEFLLEKVLPLFENSNCTININGEDKELFIDKYQFTVLFKRLIENAIKHGFNRSSTKEENIININITKQVNDKTFHEIIVENNGLPFPSEFNIYKFQMVGNTTDRRRGTGFGGFHVKRIIENHNGELQIAGEDEVRNSQFKVAFKIYIP
ncbi:UNVERIFIED_CONTAM: N-6 DNA methylase [Ralstonia mannitolilytica]